MIRFAYICLFVLLISCDQQLYSVNESGSQVYLSSYVMSVGDNILISVPDACLKVDHYPLIAGKTFIIEYEGSHYFFKILRIRDQVDFNRITRQHINYLYGMADCMGEPYSLKQSSYVQSDVYRTKAYTTLWIIPMKFNIKSKINNKRAFVFTNDPLTIKNLPLCQ